MNRVLEEMLRHLMSDTMNDWDDMLAAAELTVKCACYNFQQSTHDTPFQLNHGYHPAVPLDVGVSPNPLFV